MTHSFSDSISHLKLPKQADKSKNAARCRVTPALWENSKRTHLSIAWCLADLFCRDHSHFLPGHHSFRIKGLHCETMEEARTGFLTRFSMLQKDGQSLHVVLKGWATHQAAYLRWDMPRLLINTGWTPTAHVPLSKYIYVNIGVWIRHLESLQLYIQPIGQSGRSVSRCHPSSDTPDIEATQWVSTGGLLGLVLLFSSKRKSLEAKEQCRRLLTAFIRHTLDGASARALIAEAPGGQITSSCPQCLESEPCTHVTRALQRRDGEPPQQQLADTFLMAWAGSDECAALKQMVSWMADRLAVAIDKNVAAYADFHYHSTTDANIVIGKRKRMDAHARQVASRKVQQGQHACHAEACRAQGKSAQQARSERLKEMSIYKAKTLAVFNRGGSIGLVFDCARVGRPASEMLLAHLQLASTPHSCVLPPQVPWGQTVTQ